MPETKTTVGRHWIDIRFYCVAELSGDHWMDFQVHAVHWADPDGRPEFLRAGWESNADTTSEMREAEVFLRGNVKWDGCANWHFAPGDACVPHTCDRADVAAIGEMMLRVFAMAKELIPTWDATYGD